MNETVNTSLNITVKPNGEAEIRVTKAPLPEIIRLCLLTIEVSCKRSLEDAEKQDPDFRDAIASDLHELINVGASTLLNRLFPEIEMRPDLTVEAILEAENKIMDENPDFVKEAHEAYLNSTDFARAKALSDATKATLPKSTAKRTLKSKKEG